LVNSIFLLKNADLLGEHVAHELSQVKKQHSQWLSLLEKSLQSYWKLTQRLALREGDGLSPFSQNLSGIRVQVKGRLNGKDRKQKRSFSVGCLSLQEFNTSVDYSYTESFTRYGVLGVKV
jgi:hypothetical protein